MEFAERVTRIQFYIVFLFALLAFLASVVFYEARNVVSAVMGVVGLGTLALMAHDIRRLVRGVSDAALEVNSRFLADRISLYLLDFLIEIAKYTSCNPRAVPGYVRLLKTLKKTLEEEASRYEEKFF